MARLRLPPSKSGAGKAGARTSSGKRTSSPRIVTKRIYDPAAVSDGTRVLIMRYWPRGIRKERVDVWLRELAPVVPLLRGYLAGNITWTQYRLRYLAGLERPEAQEALAEVRRLARKGRVTLLCGCANPRRCHRSLLQEHLLDSAGNDPGTAGAHALDRGRGGSGGRGA